VNGVLPPALQAAIRAVDDLLPQTQCTQCGHGGCLPYAQAIVTEGAPINRCPPGGAQGIAALAAHTGQAIRPLDPTCGQEAPRHGVRIIGDLCIGCTKCIQACPVDAIVGAHRRMHAVIPELCTGCDLCIAPCPVDCIERIPVEGDPRWGPPQAHAARSRYQRRALRLRRVSIDQQQRREARGQQDLQEPALDQRKRAVIEAALARARARRHAAP
jgi:electron transport complex protein RnfB